MKRLWRLLGVAFAATVLAACGGDGDDDGADGGPLRGEITVYAASSLTEAFKEIGASFSRANPGVRVTFNFAGSAALATQINEGAPADVFASADQAQVTAVVDKGNAVDPVVFATNVPVVVVPRSGSPVATFADLAKPGVRLVLAGPAVPIGRYSREVLEKASAASGGVAPDFAKRVLANVRSNEADVRAVLAKVQLGEADAGIVYSTDAATQAARVTRVEIPAAFNVTAHYPIAVVKGSKNAAAALAFVEFVQASASQAILANYGFGPAQPR